MDSFSGDIQSGSSTKSKGEPRWVRFASWRIKANAEAQQIGGVYRFGAEISSMGEEVFVGGEAGWRHILLWKNRHQTIQSASHTSCRNILKWPCRRSAKMLALRQFSIPWRQS